MAHAPTWLTSGFVYLTAAVLLVPLARALRLGAIIGYLAAGIAIGPWGLGLVKDVQTTLEFAEFGVVLMLFLIGLELQPQRLWSLRRPILGLGTAQMLACALALYAVGWLAGLPWRVALVGALGLALSSTAIALQVLAERQLLRSDSGQAAFSVLLFQDIAALPILALLPLLGGAVLEHNPPDASHALVQTLKTLGVVGAVVLGGHVLLRPLLRWIAQSRTPEIFTATALLLVVGIALLMVGVGLSMALGAFLAGVLLADSEYRRELETDIEPFKDLLLGLFFMAVGMTIDFTALARAPLTMAVLVLGFIGIKALVIYALARSIGMTAQERPVFTLLLAQGGEFAFVVFQTASSAKVLAPAMASQLTGAVALSMLLSPLLLVLLDRLVLRHFTHTPAATGAAPAAELSEPQQAPILIAGFGRYGQIVARVLLAQGVPTTVLDHSVEMLEVARTFGYRVHYGDATRLHLLRTAGAAQARVLVVAVDTPEQSLKIVQLARKHFPHLEIVARARDITHWNQLRELGVMHIERELFESSLASARSTLHLLGLPDHEVQSLIERFRTHNLALIEQLHPYRHDREKFINFTRQGREQLMAQLAKERQERQRDPTPTPPPATPSP